MVVDVNVAAHQRAVGEGVVVAELDVVSEVAVDHEVVVVADGGGFITGGGVDGGVFAENIVVAGANACGGRTWGKFAVLRFEAEADVRVEGVGLTEGDRPLKVDVGDQARTWTENGGAEDDAVWTDEDIIGQAGLRVDGSGGMDLGQGSGALCLL